ncbi:MAG: peptidase T [Firmicutes bacterium]|nr:peptidase T [Bacillota bacterium]
MSILEDVKKLGLAERFMGYCRVDTQSADEAPQVPSTAKQHDLAKLLYEEMQRIGLADVKYDEKNCYVYGYVPASEGVEAETVGFVGHMDTAPQFSGTGVKPKMFKYEGGDIVLENGLVTAVKEFPFLSEHVGKNLIVTDGTTLLGADDKAGVAEIITMAEYLVKHPEVKHGRVALCFTPDEEVGHLAAALDLEAFGAAYAYTLDGAGLGGIDYECFNAAGAKVIITGQSIHPGSAKNKMKNALLYAAEFINMLPGAEAPAHTEGYEGYYHPTDMEGTDSGAVINFILRDFTRDGLEKRKALVKAIAAFLNAKYGEWTVDVVITDQYNNMAELLESKMYIVDKAKDAMKACGVEPETVPIRGGTDGCALTFRGLPCPNLCTGSYNHHGPRELAVVEDMEKIVEILVTLVSVK